jgi:hypothetical protein
MAVLEKVVKKYWDGSVKEVEPHELIWFEPDGGIDINGEWESTGSYSITVPPNRIGNSYRYEGSLERGYYNPKTKRQSKTGWHVTLKVVGGEFNRLAIEVLNKRANSKKQARKMIVEAIREFEQTDRFKTYLWPEILHPDRRQPIIKEINGQFYWIATTWKGTWTALQKTISCGWRGERPFGSGTYYTREVQWRYDFPFKGEDGSTDYDRSVKVYEEPLYRKFEMDVWGLSDGGKLDEETKAKIDEAIFDLHNLVQVYIMRQKYQKLQMRS